MIGVKEFFFFFLLDERIRVHVYILENDSVER